MNLVTVLFILLIGVLLVLAVRRIIRKGSCDCGSPEGCSGREGCGGCPKSRQDSSDGDTKQE